MFNTDLWADKLMSGYVPCLLTTFRNNVTTTKNLLRVYQLHARGGVDGTLIELTAETNILTLDLSSTKLPKPNLSSILAGILPETEKVIHEEAYMMYSFSCSDQTYITHTILQVLALDRKIAHVQ